MKLLTTSYLLFCTLLLTASGCHHVTEPQPPASVKLDSTSHNFLWQTGKIDREVSGILHGISIVNDTLIYAVGAYFLADSLGTVDPVWYNFVTWNGREWIPSRVGFVYGTNTVFAELWSVFAFSVNDVWVGSSAPLHWNGSAWDQYDLRGTDWQGLITGFWGTSSKDLYAVGSTGQVMHFDGSKWQSLTSGTTLWMNDVWGAVNTLNGEEEVLAAASDANQSRGKHLFKLTTNGVSTLPDSGLSVMLGGIWFSARPGHRYYVAGGGVFTAPSLSGLSRWEIDSLPHTSYFTNAIRGNDDNDIVIVGYSGTVQHYNGSTWHDYTGHELPLDPSTIYFEVDFKQGVVCAVGYQAGKSAILLGKRSL